MRLVIDLQGAQGSSRKRGIGRYSRALALAMAQDPGPHEPIILLNEALPDSADELYADFLAVLPRSNIRSWRGLAKCGEVGGPQHVQRRRVSEVIRANVLASLDADLIHVASMIEGAGDDVVSGWPVGFERPEIVATFYDAIPLIRKKQYLEGGWGTPELGNWYRRQLHELVQCAGLLAISASSRDEAVSYLGFCPDRAFNVRAGFDSSVFAPRKIGEFDRDLLLSRHQLRQGYILFVGAGDLRKNDQGLIRAYATLPKPIQSRHQLVIVGGMDPAALRELALSLGIAAQDLALPPYVSEEDLPAIYGLCQTFVMPSKHEGFGLPALEAMACGAPVIASNTTSLPEVVGLREALFDPEDPASIAERLMATLTDPAFRARLVSHGRTQAAQFSWADSAKRSWAALETILARRAPDRQPRKGSMPRRQARLACVGPLPPDASGVADYARDLLPVLAHDYHVTLVTESGTTSDATLKALFPVISTEQFSQVAGSFDRILYQVGNSEFHSTIVQRLLPIYPGVVVMHDSYLSNIPYLDFMRSDDINALAFALFDSHGWRPLNQLTTASPEEVVRRFPCCASVFRNAVGVIQHSRHARDIVACEVSPEAAAMVSLVPHTRARWPRVGRAAARAQLHLDDSVPLTCSFGIVNATKRPLDVLAAWHSAMSGVPGALIAFVGTVSPELTAEITARAAELGIADALVLTERVDEETYRLWLEAADVALQLRTGSRGETSGAICDAMYVGLPVIANAHGSAAELPGHCLTLLPDAADVSDLAAALKTLWADPSLRQALGAAAEHYVRTCLDPATGGRLYREAIEHAYARCSPALSANAVANVRDDDMPEVARVLAQNFPESGPRRFLFDIALITDPHGASSGLAGDMVRHALVAPGAASLADIVSLGNGRLRFERRFAAKFLRLPDYGLADLPALPRPGDTLVFPLRAGTGQSDDHAATLRYLSRRGVRLVGILEDWLDEAMSANGVGIAAANQLPAISIVDAVVALSPDIAGGLVQALNEGDMMRNRALDIGWPRETLPPADRGAAQAEHLFALVRGDRALTHWVPNGHDAEDGGAPRALTSASQKPISAEPVPAGMVPD